MFYLTTHSTHFIDGYIAEKQIARERVNLPPLYGLHFPIRSKDCFYFIMSFVTPVVKHWMEREIAQWYYLE